MFPAISTIISIYAAFGILECLAQGKARYGSIAAWTIAGAIGVLALLVIANAWWEIMRAGTQAPSGLPGM